MLTIVKVYARTTTENFMFARRYQGKLEVANDKQKVVID